MVRGMTWNIFHYESGQVLTWDDKAIDFETQESAQAFLEANPDLAETAIVKDGILYYDGGYISEAEVRRIMEEEGRYQSLSIEEQEELVAAIMNAEEYDTMMGVQED